MAGTRGTRASALSIVLFLAQAFAPVQAETAGSESPFGFHPASVYLGGYPDSGFGDAERIGVRWHRPPVYAFWFLVEPDLASAEYDFTVTDARYLEVPPGISILANICPENPRHPEGYTLPGTYLPTDQMRYEQFVRATVERYDGDGANDAPGLTNPILHWQVGNEPSAGLTGFAQLQRITHAAVKQACPECTVVLGGVAGFPEGYVASFDTVYGPILDELAGHGFDVLDFHWYGTAFGDYRLRDSRTGADALTHIRATLAGHGFDPDLEVWITEMGSYSGNPAGPFFQGQSERQQAADYLKRFVYPLARGVRKVFPAFGLMEGFKQDDGYFDHTGLIYDGRGSDDLGLGVRKLGYYTYAKMTEMLAGADWSTLQMLHDGTGDDWLFLFSVDVGGSSLYIAWWDAFDDEIDSTTKILTLTGLTGSTLHVTSAVPAAAIGADVDPDNIVFDVRLYPVIAGSVALELGEDPVFAKEADLLPPRRPAGRLAP